MRKILYQTAILFAVLCFSSAIFAQQQESLRDRLARRQQEQRAANSAGESNIPPLSVRAQMFNESQTQVLSNATWIRGVYRFIDLEKDGNGALYYPVQPVGNQMNFFTMIFKLMGEGNLTGYNFNNSQEMFTDNQIIDFGDVLDKLEIPYQKNGNKYLYDEFSIPSNEVLGYYIKEDWYFDQSNSVLGVKTVAICPVVFRDEYLGDFDSGSASSAMRRPQFWIPYEDVRPYAARMPIMASDRNNVMSRTIDDYFRLRMYDGEIYKTTNMKNQFLSEKYPTEEELKAAQEKIETELRMFDEKLWVINDSIHAASPARENNKKNKASKPKNSSSGTATYSARDRR